MIDEAVQKEVIRVFDNRWRRDFLENELPIPQFLPVTAGYDEVSPHWRWKKARPDDARSVTAANPRPDGAPGTQFTPSDILGTPGGPLGTGYIENQIIGRDGFTVQAGSTVRTEHHDIELLTWLYLPKARSTELASFYTAAIKALWYRVHLLRANFAQYFTGNLGIHTLRQGGVIPWASQEGTSGQFEVLLQRIPLEVRIMVSGNHFSPA